MLLFLALTGCDGEPAEPPVAGEPEAPVEPTKPPEPPTPPEPPAATEPAAAASVPDHLLPPASHKAAPATFTIKWETTRGDFTTTCTREWSPNGADRLHHLVDVGYFEDIAFFRVISGFMVQFGLHGNPAVNKIWKEANIDDDEVKQSNKTGYLTFATAGPNTRTTQLFINYGDNARLDASGFSPLCTVDGNGMEIVNSIHSGYGEGAPMGRGPSQGLIHKQGNAYLKEKFPELDYIKKASLQ